MNYIWTKIFCVCMYVCMCDCGAYIHGVCIRLYVCGGWGWFCIQRPQELIKCSVLLLSFCVCSLDTGSLIELGARLALVILLPLLPTVLELQVSMDMFGLFYSILFYFAWVIGSELGSSHLHSKDSYPLCPPWCFVYSCNEEGTRKMVSADLSLLEY